MKHFFSKQWIAIVGLFFLQLSVSAQVNVSIQILPPYPTKFTDYASRPNLMVIAVSNVSTTNQRVQLRGTVTGDNGIVIRVKPNYKSSSPIEIGPGQTKMLNGNDIATFFDYNQLTYAGITQNDFINKGGLPEGRYQLCIRAFNYDTNLPLSADEPSGCSNSFTVSSLEPPTILGPYNEEIIPSQAGQILSLRWSTPVGTPPSIQYRIRIEEILGNKNPNDALMTANRPYFFDKEVMTNMYIYNPADPQLTPGRKYAMRVDAIDPFNTVVFKNQGKSEVISFTYGKSLLDSTKQDFVVVNNDTLLKRPTVIKGNLKYRFNDSGESGNFALANTKIYLEKVYVNITTDAVNGTQYKPYPKFVSTKIPFLNDPMDGVLAETDKDGNFEIKVGLTVLDSAGILTESHKKLLDVNKLRLANRNMLGMSTDNIGLMYRLKISNPHFKDYQELLRIVPGDTIDIAQKVVDANSYSLMVNVAEAFNGLKGRFVSNAKVRIYRLKADKLNPNLGIPMFEGDLLDSTKYWKEFGNKVLIAEAYTPTPDALVINNQSNPKPFTVIFKRLFKNLAQDGYKYLISLENGQHVIEQKSFDELSSIRNGVKMLGNVTPQALGSNNSSITSITDFAFNMILSTTQLTLLKEQVAAPRSKVTGTLKYAFKYYKGVPNQAYANMNISLRSSDNMKSVLATTKTDNLGRFTFDFANVDSIHTSLLAHARGGNPMLGSRVYYVVPEVKYYAIPDDKIIVQPWESYECGELVSLVKTYTLKLDVQGEHYQPGHSGGVDKNGKALQDVPTTYDPLTQAEVLLLRSTPYAYKSQIPNLIGMNTGKEVVFEGANAASNNYRVLGENITPNSLRLVSISIAGKTIERQNTYILQRTLYTENNQSKVIMKGLIPSLDINNDIYEIRIGSADRMSNSVAYETSFKDFPYPFSPPKMQPPQNKQDMNLNDLQQLNKVKWFDPSWGYTDRISFDKGGALIRSGLTLNEMVNVRQGLVSASPIQTNSLKNIGAGKVGLAYHNITDVIQSKTWQLLKNKISFKPSNEVIPSHKDNFNIIGPIIDQNLLVFNSQLPAQEPEFDDVGFTTRKNWRIAGRVLDGSSKLGVGNVDVYINYKLTKDFNKGYTHPVAGIMTNINGDFVITAADFNKPPNFFDDKSLELIISTQGYEAITMDIGAMKLGQQIYKDQILLIPSAKDMVGYVVEKGNPTRPVVARVKMLDNGVWVNTQFKIYPANNQSRIPRVSVVQEFKIDLPYKKVKLMIMPFDRAYMTIVKDVQFDANNKFLGLFELPKRVHHMRVNVMIKDSKDQLVPAVVTLLETGLKDTINIGANGDTANFDFINNATKNYTLHVKPLSAAIVPGKTMFVPTTITVSDDDDGKPHSHPIYVKRGKLITGQVKFDDNSAVNDAKVFLENGSGSQTENFTKSDPTGRYTLIVPLLESLQYVVRANYSEENQTYISGEKTLDAGTNIADLTISRDNTIDVNRLFGFKTLVNSLTKNNDGTYLVSGELYNLPTNNNFAIADEVLNRNLIFNKIKVKISNFKNKNNVPIGVPVDDTFLTDNREMGVRVNNAFNGLMIGTDKIAIKKAQSDSTGIIVAKVRILDNSFEFPSSYMRMDNTDFYLGENRGAEVMSVFSTQQTQREINKFLLTDSSAKAISFRYLGFKGVADISGNRTSNLSGEKISLYLNLSSLLPGNIPISLKAGVAEIFKGGIGKIVTTDTLKLKLENWTVEANPGVGSSNGTWELSPSSGGLVLKNGEIITGKLNIPFKNMKIVPSEDDFPGDLICSDLKTTGATFTIGGIAKLKPNAGSESMFVYDPGVGRDGAGHYKVSVTGANYNDYAASFAGLDGMTNPKEAFKVQIISMLSNGEELFGFANNQSVTLYNQIKFTPQTISTTSQNSLSIAGTFDLGIPGLNTKFFEPLVFTKNGLKNKVTMPVFEFSFLGKGGVKFTSIATREAQILSANGYVMGGNLDLPGGVKIKAVKLISMVSQGANALIDPTGIALPAPAFVPDITREIDVLFGNQLSIKKYFEEYKDGLNASLKAAKENLINQAEEALRAQATKLIPLGTNAAKGALGEVASYWNLGEASYKQGQDAVSALKEGNYLKLAGMMRNIPGLSQVEENVKNAVKVEAINAFNAVQQELPKFQDTPISGSGFEPGKFEFDLKNGRVFGSIAFKAITLGAVGLRDGGMEMLFSGEGWYFASGATMDIPVPILTPLKVGILIGNYGPIPQDVETRVTQLAQSVSGKLPDEIRRGLSGFFIVGGKSIVDVDVAFGIPAIAEIKLVASAGAEIRTYAKFGKGTFTMGLGALVYGRVFTSVSLLGIKASGGAALEAAIASTFKIRGLDAAMCAQGCVSVKFMVEICAPIVGCASEQATLRALVNIGVGNGALLSQTACKQKGFDFSLSTKSESCLNSPDFDF